LKLLKKYIKSAPVESVISASKAEATMVRGERRTLKQQD